MKKGYLVISRKIGERILLHGDGIPEVEILIADIDQKKTDVAIRAPKDIKIKRMLTHMEEEQEKKHNGDG